MEKIRIETHCPVCGRVHFVEVDKDKEQLAHMVVNRQIHAQDAFPEMSPSERELLISGIDDYCWNALFGEEEDEDE